MALVVAKTAYSTPVNEGMDFAGTVYDAGGELVAQGEFDLPAFVGLTHLTVPEIIRAVGRENMAPGDVYLINDPYTANTHCNDIHFIKPIFHDGRLVAFTSSTAHWADVGGAAAGSMNCRARTHFEEGMRIPAVALYKRGVINQDILSLLLINMRQSWERLGDLNAQVAAVRAGDARMQLLIEKHGLETVLAGMDEVKDYTERLARAAWARLPDGGYEVEDRVDQDVLSGEPKTVRLTLTIAGDQAVFDLSETDDAAESAINCTIAATTSAIFIALASILPPMPMNAGVMRTIEIKARRGSLVWAQPPVAVSGLAATTMDAVIGAVMLALGRALPERAVGLPAAVVNSTFAGHDTRPGFDAPYINFVWAFGGMGATKHHDGANDTAPPYGASTQNIPCELQERRYPMLHLRHMLLRDSGGPGSTRGGLGVDQLVEQRHAGPVSTIGHRERFGPSGILGGGPGQRSRVVVNAGTEQERNIGVLSVNVPVAQGELLSIWTAGGGGYGEPLERPVEQVIEDIKDDYVSIAAAEASYGVALREIDRRALRCEVDEAATRRLRERLRGERARG